MDVIEFLEARIRDDEGAAMQGYFNSVAHPLFEGGPVTQQTAELPPQVRTRVLDECAAKRLIITHCDELGAGVLFILAAVYKNHPDYRDEWDLHQTFKFSPDKRCAA